MTRENSPDFARQRERMVDQIRSAGIGDEQILAAFRGVPRELFVPPELEGSAYENSPLPIGLGQTISQPFIVAYMIQLAEIGPSARVLEIGTGSGYSAAVLSKLAQRVYTIERQPFLFESGRERLSTPAYSNVETHLADGTLGWPEQAPFDAILVAAAAVEFPSALVDQLRLVGRLIIPAGERPTAQKLLRITRTTIEGDYETEDFGEVSFVPLVPGT